MADQLTPDDMRLEHVAARLGKSVRWLQELLKNDVRRPTPVFQFHNYIGRDRVWSEEQYQALKAAIHDTGGGTKLLRPKIVSMPAPSGPLDAVRALRKLKALRLAGRPRPPAKRRLKSPTKTTESE